MTDTSEHLIAAIADLRGRRDVMDNAIRSMEAVLATVYGSSTASFSSSGTLTTSGTVSRNYPSEARSERVRQIIESDPLTEWTAVDIALELDDDTIDGSDLLKAINSITSRLHKRGLVTKVGRGVYRWSVDSTDTSGPDESGPEGDVTTTDTGGDPHVQTDRENHGEGVQPALRDDRGGAPVGASPW